MDQKDEVMTSLANRWQRIWGAAIDSVIYMVITMSVMLVSGVLPRLFSEERMKLGQRDSLV